MFVDMSQVGQHTSTHQKWADTTCLIAGFMHLACYIFATFQNHLNGYNVHSTCSHP